LPPFPDIFFDTNPSTFGWLLNNALFFAVNFSISLNTLSALLVKRKVLVNQQVHTDGLHLNKGVAHPVAHITKVTPPEMVDEWLTWVHISITSLKHFLLGIFQDTTKLYLQNYFYEFCYRFNRRFWVAEIPNRPVLSCVDHHLN
jgi:hypothetical protein